MAREPESAPQPSVGRSRVPPYSEEAEQGVLGSVLLDATRVMDLCIAGQLSADSFYVPAHRLIFEAMLGMAQTGMVIDVLTLSSRLQSAELAERIGGLEYLHRLVDTTPTAAHAEYYIDIVRQKELLRSIISHAIDAENQCYSSTEESAFSILSRTQQAFLDISERQHGGMVPWQDAVKSTMVHVDRILTSRRGLSGLPTGFGNIDKVTLGLRAGEMIVLAARPSMGKTSLAMNVAQNIAMGDVVDHVPRAVGVFSLEMSCESLVLRMLCSEAKVSAHALVRGMVSAQVATGKLTQAASRLMKARVLMDDTGGLDVLELRARARRMKAKHDIQLVVVDYLQLLHSAEFARQGRQVETANISGHLKSMAKELKLPVLVLSQLSRAPEQRDKLGKPKMSDLRDSGAIEQDADVVWLLRRPCKYPDDPQAGDESLAIVEIAKNRNGPTDDAELNFEDQFMLFHDRQHGVDEGEPLQPAGAKAAPGPLNLEDEEVI